MGSGEGLLNQDVEHAEAAGGDASVVHREKYRRLSKGKDDLEWTY